jgi:hypothetical protein
LKLNKENENEPGVKPFNKRKGKSKSETSNQLEQDNTFGKIDEFNSDTWSIKTNDWIKGALDRGFDSMAIMQPLIDEAQQVARQSGLHAEAAAAAVGPSSQFRTKITEGAVPDSDEDGNDN